MAIGERIRFIRNLRGMSQKYLGQSIGFSEKTADVRIAQYESGTRTPKDNFIDDISQILGVSPAALKVPNIDDDIGLAHTLFAIEDLYGLTIKDIDGQICLAIDKGHHKPDGLLYGIFRNWSKTAEKFRADVITKEEYDEWRYNYVHDQC